MDRSLNVTMVNQLLSNDDVTVTLLWPREPGAVYHINALPQSATNAMNIIINLTVLLTTPLLGLYLIID